MVNQSQIPDSNLANPIDILIVDDVPDNIRLLTRILVKRGFQTRKALNGRMALTAIQASKPRLILLDVQMPDMTGYELCHRIKSDPDSLHIPIIFLSANDDTSEKRKAIHLGGADYISKPFNIEKLVGAIHHQLKLASIS
ncbi:response regulator [Laspinema olomoucense]|uniref:Response regulator n=1 Tax=Laspinema olomoucense D3b TaxID=2953688 RepID=A0ABT2N9F6_9CYAN|nr:response regulator [Laspinema sp. D3b]MCT7979329.1 response regulator [Laspinema sp. D3b]